MIVDLMKTCFFSIFEVLAVGMICAYFLGAHKESDNSTDIFSRLFVSIALPCLVFHNMATKFAPAEVPFWWIFPLLGIGQFAIGGLVAYAYRSIDKSVRNPGVFAASIAFHNSVLLPLAFAPSLFGPEKLARFLNVLFLYNMLTVPAFFSIGLWLVHSSSVRRFRVTDIINPPIAATVIGFIFALGGWGNSIPHRTLAVFQMLGSLSTPLSVLIVGGTIVGSITKTAGGVWKEPVVITVFKCFVIPVLTTAAVYVFKPPSEIALFLIIGAVMPVASIVAVIVPDEPLVKKTVAGGILLSNLASIITVPVFLSIYGVLYGW